jgi:3-oxoacyl-[acyl-carrier protein] reductase
MTDALSEDVKKEISGMIPLGGPCEPEAIADAVIFLSGPGSSYITGQVLAVNGGMYM